MRFLLWSGLMIASLLGFFSFGVAEDSYAKSGSHAVTSVFALFTLAINLFVLLKNYPNNLWELSLSCVVFSGSVAIVHLLLALKK